MASTLKKLARLILPAALFDAVRHWADQRRKYFGLFDLDRQIEKFLDYDDGFYVELGANDGKLASNTVYYERRRNWRGVLIEPVPGLYLECRRNRSLQKNYMTCAACVPFGYKDEFVKITYSNSMSVSMSLESDLEDKAAHSQNGQRFLKPHEDIFAFGSVARTLNSILADAGAPRSVDLLSLDVEGAELDVLKGIDHTTYRFKYVLVECRDLTRLQDYLAAQGYSLIEKFNMHDYLFKDGAPLAGG